MITEAQVADAINYLYAAQAVQPVDGMARVWADYVNHAIPDCRGVGLRVTLPATKTPHQPPGAHARLTRPPLRSFTSRPHSRTALSFGSPTLLPFLSFLFTHQVKLSSNFWNTFSKKNKSALPLCFSSILKTLKVAQACTGGLTSLKFHS